jgi:nicotinate-nucleotide adenylyltransferase
VPGSSNGEKQKIGLMGGTFDPVHKGHLAVARQVLDRYRLDIILFLPAAQPPHKERRLTQFAHRLAMLEACLAEEPAMSATALEAERRPPSYTVDTLAELHRRLGEQNFYLIIGADMFVEIELWHRYRDIFRLADLIVAARPGVSDDAVRQQAEALPGPFTYEPRQRLWQRRDGFRIFYLAETAEDVSSTRVRRLLARGEPVDELLPGPVLHYIRRHGLYATAAQHGNS